MSADQRIDELLTIAKLVRDGQVHTRSEIGDRLGLRSTTVSELVGRLVAADLLHEVPSRRRGPGRPAAALNFNVQRIGAVFVTVVGRELIALNIDLGRRALSETRVAPPADISTEGMARCLHDLVRDAIQLFPSAIEPGTVVISLSGLLDVPNGVWAFSSRWPRITDLKLREALGDLSLPVHVVRNLDAELEGLLLRAGSGRTGSTLILHWGQGIGAAFHDGTKVVNRDLGRFCEIGHWRLGDARGRPCTCGATDCLETIAALWALAPHLRRSYGCVPDDEVELAEMFWRLDLDACPAMRHALDEVLRVTTNLCRLLFPGRIVLTGPFVQNAEILAAFTGTLQNAPLLKSLDRIRITVGEIGLENEIAGALAGPLDGMLRRVLSGGGDAAGEAGGRTDPTEAGALSRHG